MPFAFHYRPLWMGLGIVALYLLLAVWVTTLIRKRIGHQAWRRVHGLAFVVYAAATVHGLGAGSDTRTFWGTAVYVVSVVLVVGSAGRLSSLPAPRAAPARLSRLRPVSPWPPSGCGPWGVRMPQTGESTSVRCTPRPPHHR